MKVVCRKLISATTKESMESSPWVKIGREYVVFAIEINPRFGVRIVIQTEHYNDPGFIDVDGFEFINQKIPSSWVTDVSEVYGKKVMTMLPASWNYDSFFEDLDNEEPKAVALYKKEVEQMNREEGLI